MTHYVYITVDTRNGFYYVGKHSWEGEGLDPSYPGSGLIINSIKKKYSNWKDFLITSIICKCSSQEEAYEKEKDIIDFFDCVNHKFSYNLNGGGHGGMSGLCIESRKKMSESRKGHTVSQETRDKISAGNKGKKLSEKTRIKMSLSRKGREVSQETREKLRTANTGKKASEETKRKLSESHRGLQPTAAARQKTSEVHKKLWADEEYRNRMIEERKNRWKDQDFRKMMSEKAKIGWQKRKLNERSE